MDPKRPIGTLVVLLVAAAAVGVIASLFTENVFLLSSEWQTPALVTAGFVAVVVAALIAIAGPRGQWISNPYW